MKAKMLRDTYEGGFCRVFRLEELVGFTIEYLLNFYVEALEDDDPRPHDYLAAIEAKIDKNSLNFGWRYNSHDDAAYNGYGELELYRGGKEECPAKREVELCGGETELLYLFKTYLFMIDEFWSDSDVIGAADFLYNRVLLRFVRFLVKDKAYWRYLGVKDKAGLNIVDYDVTSALDMGSDSLLAAAIKDSMDGPKYDKIIETPPLYSRAPAFFSRID